MNIYVIMHSGGEYDCYRSWINKKCFSDKDKAEEFVSNYNKRLKERIIDEKVKDETCSSLLNTEICDLNCDKCEYKNEYWSVSEEHECSIIELELN